MQCHQDTGKGLPGTYPPLVGSPIVLGDPAIPIRILLHGLQGDVTVEGATYNGQMPSWDRFSDEQIAAVLTYVRGAWTNERFCCGSKVSDSDSTADNSAGTTMDMARA